MKSDIILQKRWICRCTGQVEYSYGMIHDMGIHMDIEEKELLNDFGSEMEILSTKRLHKRDQKGKSIKSESIHICFKGSLLSS